MSRPNSLVFASEQNSTINDFQDVCRSCFSFNAYCRCASFDSESSELIKKDSTSMKEVETSICNVLYYYPPTENDEVRRGSDNLSNNALRWIYLGIDIEEYCLKSRFRYKIPAKESRAIVTNLFIRRRQNEIPRKLEVLNRIKSEWLNATFNSLFITKTGVISPSFQGDLIIKIYNKSCSEILVEPSSPVGILRSSLYDYH